MKLLGTFFTLTIFAASLMAWAQTPPPQPAPANSAPRYITLTAEEKQTQSHLLREMQELQWKEQDFVEAAAKAHHVDMNTYHYEIGPQMFIPNPSAPPAPRPPAAPAKK